MSRFPTIPRIPAMAARSRTSGKRRWRESALSAAVMCAVIGLPAAAVPQQASIIGQLSNFDTFNDTGVDAHGFEIELEGVHSADVQYFFGAPYNRYGTPTVTDFTDGARWGARVRWAAVFVQGSGYSATTVPGPANPTPTDGHSCYLYGPAGATQAQYDASGCEHFGIGTWGTPTNTAYHWLIDDGSATGTLVWSGTSVSVPAPTWSVSNNGAVAAALPALPPAPVAALPGVPACALWGDALWMKIYKTESHQPAKLGALLTDSKDVPQEAAEVETEWKFLQGRPTCDDTGKPLAQQPGNEVVNEAVAGGSAESVTRRYEFYRYTGTYDDTDGGNHEALPLCDSNPYKASCGSPAQAKPNADLGGYIGAQMAAANIGRFGVQAPALSVVKDGDGSGLVADGGGISCGDLCGGNYAAGTKVVLTATPDAGSSVQAWSVPGCGRAPTCTVTLDADTAVTVTFKAGAAPTASISSVTPASGAAGTTIRIAGSGLAEPLAVAVNGVAAAVTSAADGEISALIPCGAGTGPITVTTAAGTASGPTFAETVAKPTITALSAKSAYAGTRITVTGTNLLCTTSVTVAGIGADFTALLPTSLSVLIPGNAGSGVVTATNAAGVAKSSSLSVSPAPTVATVTPLRALPGSTVTVTGQSLKALTAVRFATTTAKFKAASATSMTVTVPAGAASGNLTFDGPTGVLTYPQPFTVLPVPAAVASVSPASGPPLTTITVKGTNFTPGMTANIGGVFVPCTTVSPTVALVTAGSSSGRVVVRTAAGDASGGTFTSTSGAAKVTLTKVSSATAGRGAALTVTGTNLAALARVSLGRADVGWTVLSATTAVMALPAGSSTGPITGWLASGASIQGPQVTVSATPAAPSITGVSPGSAIVGAVIKVSGSNLAGAVEVQFAGREAVWSVTSATTLSVVVPIGASSGAVEVRTDAGTAISGTVKVT